MKLEQYLKDHDIKPSDFAARLGRPASTITRLIKNERSPSLALMQEIAIATNGAVTANDFMHSRPFAGEGAKVA